MIDEDISAFAFNTGKMIERFINKTNNNLEEDYKQLQALVLDFRNKIKCDWIEMPYRYNEEFLKQYDEHFTIRIQESGEIKKDE